MHLNAAGFIEQDKDMQALRLLKFHTQIMKIQTARDKHFTANPARKVAVNHLPTDTYTQV